MTGASLRDGRMCSRIGRSPLRCELDFVLNTDHWHNISSPTRSLLVDFKMLKLFSVRYKALQSSPCLVSNVLGMWTNASHGDWAEAVMKRWGVGEQREV